MNTGISKYSKTQKKKVSKPKENVESNVKIPLL